MTVIMVGIFLLVVVGPPSARGTVPTGKCLVASRLVAEDILEDEGGAGVAQNKIQPGNERDDRERDGAVHVGVARADELLPLPALPDKKRSYAREKPAPVLNQNEGEQRDQQRKGVL